MTQYTYPKQQAELYQPLCDLLCNDDDYRQELKDIERIELSIKHELQGGDKYENN